MACEDTSSSKIDKINMGKFRCENIPQNAHLHIAYHGGILRVGILDGHRRSIHPSQEVAAAVPFACSVNFLLICDLGPSFVKLDKIVLFPTDKN